MVTRSLIPSELVMGVPHSQSCMEHGRGGHMRVEVVGNIGEGRRVKRMSLDERYRDSEGRYRVYD